MKINHIYISFGIWGKNETKQKQTSFLSLGPHSLHLRNLCSSDFRRIKFNVDQHLCRTLLAITSPNLSCIEKTLHSLSAIEDSRWAIYFCYNQDQVWNPGTLEDSLCYTLLLQIQREGACAFLASRYVVGGSRDEFLISGLKLRLDLDICPLLIVGSKGQIDMSPKPREVFKNKIYYLDLSCFCW